MTGFQAISRIANAAFAKKTFAACGAVFFMASAANASLLTDPNDIRTWQGANVGTFAALYYGANTAVNRQLVIDNHLLDDGLFDTSTGTAAAMILGGGGTGFSVDTDGTGDPFEYGIDLVPTSAVSGSSIDNKWVQTSGHVGDNVWDLGGLSNKAAIFNTIDHGPLPLEAIESTVYLSVDGISWVQAVTQRVWLEGFMLNTDVLWDGFVYAVGTGDSSLFRYASITWGGPGALQADGDNEINGVMGLDVNFEPVNPVPLPAALPLLAAALAGLGLAARKRRRASA